MWSTSSVSWVIWPKCNILIGLSYAVVYIYMIQAMCFCWLSCFVPFRTNTCQLFITKDGFSVWFWNLLLRICFVYFIQRKSAAIENQYIYCCDSQPSYVNTCLIIYAYIMRKTSIHFPKPCTSLDSVFVGTWRRWWIGKTTMFPWGRWGVRILGESKAMA